MFNQALFKMEWKQNYKVLIIFMLILTMYTTIMISMYDPNLGTALDEFAKMMPEVMSMVGMTGDTSTLASFLSTYLYGLIMVVFPLIFIVMLSIRLLVRKVDNGFMAYLLSSGVTRKTVWSTQLMVLLSNIIALIAYCVILSIVCSMLMFPGELDISAYLRLNLGVLILHVAFGAIAYLCSSVFDEARMATMVGAGIPVIFVLIQMLANMKGNLADLKYATMLTLFDSTGLLANESNAYGYLGILILIALVCLIAGNMFFKKRNLPL